MVVLNLVLFKGPILVVVGPMVRRRYATKFSSTIDPSTMHGRQKIGMAFLINLVKINISTFTKLLLSKVPY
jgi:hypothetical protein